jgi:cellulose synthase/poly-beta-1,6-N-acetylglucosamine synthase-like glycosyltransferase
LPPASDILAASLHAACALLTIYWTVALTRLWRTSRTHPTAKDGLSIPLPEPAPMVCVVVPAHNEGAVISHLIASLRDQDYPAFRVVLCLDRCTDDTLVRAREAAGDDARFQLLEITHCPDGWAGKVNAVRTGVEAAADPAARAAPLILFADADTTFAPGCLRATVAIMIDRRLDLLSLLSTLTCDRWFELLAQPAAAIETVSQYPILRASRAHRRRAFANGQFMLFRRVAYDAVGGHASVRDELLEDMALARRIAEAEKPAAVVLADGMLTCRMYASWAEFSRGWRRIYTELARRSPARLRRCAARSLIFGSLLPLAALACTLTGLASEPHAVRSILIGAASLTPMLLVVGWVYRHGRVPLWAIVGFPIGAALIAWLLLRAARDLVRGRAVEWGGRSYVREVAK